MAKPDPRGRSGQLRIIGGTWRGRKLRFYTGPGLRPTGDRIRETLFNWLSPVIHDARCLDLFAGSGALGLEALSRGAAHCDFVDSSKRAAAQIGAHLQALQASAAGTCHNQAADAFLRTATGPYDVVFIDPPFESSLAPAACAALVDRALLAPGAMVYLETSAAAERPAVPANWQLHREKTSGGVAFALFIARD
ncbi:MAG: 16S rRNA (guanine(966)-N(2))-methyltransferase RsmD [Halioglobus sp.]|nr:16S rRNA (guanine(966)-N(2))-methyltransferase RsmD [Halioglobus sp.]